jgi:hypothetical protein
MKQAQGRAAHSAEFGNALSVADYASLIRPTHCVAASLMAICSAKIAVIVW